jgi:hypothetical protein
MAKLSTAAVSTANTTFGLDAFLLVIVIVEYLAWRIAATSPLSNCSTGYGLQLILARMPATC